MARYKRELGWRAYAIPVLAVITVWLLVDIVAGGDKAQETVQGASPFEVQSSSQEGRRGAGPDPADSAPSDLIPSHLPPGGPFAQTGAGTFRVIGSPQEPVGKGTEKTLTYIIEVEDGVNTAVYGGDDAVAQMIDATLTDPRSWIADPRFRVHHVSPGDNPEMRIRLASVDTTQKTCGAEDFAIETSCRTSLGGNTVMINDSRWARGAVPFEGDLGSYRQYVINHEVGHGLGYASHVPCGGDGELAPVMMQQTIGLNNSELHKLAPEEVYPDDNATCRYNPWPYPTGVVTPENAQELK
ncbi:DUF3152 domain-containing protein [Corynebacterium tapiri]|uniref:DUF3152 domain-containing protein n=1 Tax=Corynebacterium tapiri TaxID=1448266 RepID=UPI001FE83A6E|nr:DUF3152 domain-containing protein [Corynebacterium tapiri]